MIESIDITITPDELRAGGQVTIEAKIVGDSSEVKRLVATVPEYDLTQSFSPIADNQYRLVTAVPWEAPSGNYNVEVYAQGERWNVLARTSFNVRVR